MLIIILGLLLILFGLVCFLISFIYFIKYIYLKYVKGDTDYINFLQNFNKQYKDILKDK